MAEGRVHDSKTGSQAAQLILSSFSGHICKAAHLHRCSFPHMHSCKLQQLNGAQVKCDHCLMHCTVYNAYIHQFCGEGVQNCSVSDTEPSKVLETVQCTHCALSCTQSTPGKQCEANNPMLNISKGKTTS